MKAGVKIASQCCSISLLSYVLLFLFIFSMFLMIQVKISFLSVGEEWSTVGDNFTTICTHTCLCFSSKEGGMWVFICRMLIVCVGTYCTCESVAYRYVLRVCAYLQLYLYAWCVPLCGNLFVRWLYFLLCVYVRFVWILRTHKLFLQ